MNATRRKVIVGAGVSGLAAVVAACGGGSETTADAPAETAAGGTDGGGSGGGGLTTTGEIPVGGGKVFKDQKVVVTQPAEGTFKAFDATCTHQGCAVGSVADGTITCPCHMSKFSAADGSVQQGPATKPLAEKQITVSGDQITLS